MIGRLWKFAAVSAALFVTAAAWGAGSGAERGGGAGLGLDTGQIVARLPADIEFILAVHDAAGQRDSGPGRAVAAAMGEAVFLERTRGAWNELSRTLGWTPEETFDRLLGQRVVLVGDWKQSGPAGGALPPPTVPGWARASWALLSDVDAATERRLRERLDLTPRDIVRGTRLLTGEGGRFRLAVFGGEGGATLLLALREDEALFGRVFRALSSSTEAGPRAPEGIDSDIWAVYRRGGAAGGDRLTVSATLTEGGWDAQISASPGLAGPVCGDAGWAGTLDESLFDGAALGVAGVGLGALGRTGQFVGLMVGAAPPELRRLVGPRTYAGLWPAGPEGLSLVMGIEVRDVRAAAPLGDAFLGELVGNALVSRAGGADGPGPDFGGLFPGAVRSAAPAAGGPVLSWAYRGRGFEHAPAGEGWWVIVLGPRGLGEDANAGMVERIGRALGSTLEEANPVPGARPADPVSRGTAGPGELVRWLGGLGLDPEGVLGPLRRIGRVEWELRRGPDGSCLGRVRVRTAGGG